MLRGSRAQPPLERDGSPRDGSRAGTWCFECVRSIWVPRTNVWVAVNTACGVLAYGLSVVCGSAILWVGGASAAAYGALVGLRTLEERVLHLSDDVVQDRSAVQLGPMCIPASAFAAMLCCIHALCKTWLPRVL